ncbi:hypothetical protein ILUMI_26665 [Ignelater luminosus]|uniref:Leucine-rich repeat-containing protein 27 n=1 Tax=Ignelater luminosus TaxID=2038154 RepID=A0A8K0FYG0_IGNLU|nr:hypothetical protein ILUMI_26665 [Ignelater luminosus]
MSIIDVISDNSNKNLEEVPEKVLEMYNLKMLYLEGNFIESLPDDFFDKLSRLTWLDLRRNKLKTIPFGIANHSFLETLLLQDNQIEALPNEIGLVPNLKVLQLSGNPLTYPPRELIDDGIHSICQFLKEEYHKSNESNENVVTEEDEHSIVEAKSSTQLSRESEKVSVRELLQRSAKRRRDEEEHVKTKKSNALTLKPCASKKIHKITRSCSKISLRSHYQWNSLKKKPSEELIQNNQLKEIWINKLKDLLADQEKILQQEKNLQTLSKWRLEKKAEAPRSSVQNIPEAPYAMDPECNHILSRKDLTMQVDSMIKKSKSNIKRDTNNKKVDIQKLINQVVDQMKNMETQLHEAKSPRTEQEIAAKQIESIVALHKKIMALQTTNATTL